MDRVDAEGGASCVIICGATQNLSLETAVLSNSNSSSWSNRASCCAICNPPLNAFYATFLVRGIEVQGTEKEAKQKHPNEESRKDYHAS